jgi:hypothetical protein
MILLIIGTLIAMIIPFLVIIGYDRNRSTPKQISRRLLLLQTSFVFFIAFLIIDFIYLVMHDMVGGPILPFM